MAMAWPSHVVSIFILFEAVSVNPWLIVTVLPKSTVKVDPEYVAVTPVIGVQSSLINSEIDKTPSLRLPLPSTALAGKFISNVNSSPVKQVVAPSS